MRKIQKTTDISFSDKWPPGITKKGFIQIPNCIIACRANLNLSSSELAILLQLCIYDYGSKKVWPSHSTLAKQAGLGLSTVRNHIVSLESKGFIKRQYRSGTSNVYDLLPLLNKLKNHSCYYPARKELPPYLEISRPPPQKTSTKEELLKRINNNTEPIENILRRKYE